MFKQFADSINKKFLELSTLGTLLRVNVSKEALWETYQGAFPTEHNQIFRERRTHECNTCYSFIKRLGPVVGVINGQVDSIWNVQNLPEPYQTVANQMHALVTSANISSVFLSDERVAGKEYNIEETEAGNIRWDHFYADINQAFISQNVVADSGEISSIVEVFIRGLNEFSIETLQSVIDLCDSIYRGEEFKPTVESFLRAKLNYESAPNKTVFIWTAYKFHPAKIRNTAIGTLIIDVQAGVDLEEAVSKYEKVVAPTNYKRTTAIVTESMKKQALEFININGLRDSLPRRHAKLSDISVNNVLFANSNSQAVMKDSIDSILDAVVTKSTEVPTKAVEVTIDQFLQNVLPNSKNIELLLENRLTPNFVSLVAPVNPEAPNMLKWNNNFSWSYAGEMTDSYLTKRVEAAGGRTDGVFRFTHSWNELEPNQSLMDLHVFMPGCDVPTIGGGPNVPGRRVGWNHREDTASGGKQDVDYTSAAPKDYVPVENITFPTLSKMPEGVYTCKIHNWSFRNTGGKGRAEIAINGEVYQYIYPKTRNEEWVTIAEVTLSNGVFSINHKIPLENSSKKVWEVDTKQYQKVSTIMLSPNHWDGQQIGNKHYFFMLDGCNNPDPVRGFYNEFLSDEFRPNRKVFEVLSGSMKCTPEKDQLSGLGFSSTQSNEVFVKVDGRPYKIIF